MYDIAASHHHHTPQLCFS